MNPKLTGVLLTFTLAALAACGDGKDNKGAAPAAGGNAKGAAAAPAGGAAYDAAKSTASVKVTVKWTGAKIEPQKITMSGDTYCTGLGSTDDPRFVVNADGTLPNAFVWAKDGPHKGMTGLPESPKATLDQHGCMYVPHVFGLRAGQAFTVKNSDQTTHNVHPRPKTNDGFNPSQAAGATNDFTFKNKEKAIPFACDIHSWMNATAFVLDHPFFGTTGADGTVTIGNLPPGKYKFVAWHEPMSADSKGHEVEFDVEVAAGDSKAVGADLK
jgi:plastocyanin